MGYSIGEQCLKNLWEKDSLVASMTNVWSICETLELSNSSNQF